MVKSETEEVPPGWLDNLVGDILDALPGEGTHGEDWGKTYETTITDDSIPYHTREYSAFGSTPEESQERASEKFQKGYQW